MSRLCASLLFISIALSKQILSSGNPLVTVDANTQEARNAADTDDRPMIEEARRQAKIRHTAMHSTLQIVHHRYYKENESMPLPAASLKEVFAVLEKEEHISMRWLAVDGEAMNVEHKPQNAFESDAVKALKSGLLEFERLEDGVYRRAGSITLSNVCLKCHVPDRKSLENRNAGLIMHDGYGGLRCSSEVALLKWSDIHWDVDRFTVTSPKTKRFGKATRVVPLFPELRPILDEAFSMAETGENWVVSMLGGDANKNLGTTLRKIIYRSGVAVWTKPFQNCRSNRQTELEQHFPTYVVCAWMGNTPNVAHKHYLTATDEHFQKASTNLGDQLGMQTPVLSRKDSHKKNRSVHSVRENATFSEVVGILENTKVAAEGFEPPTRGL